MKLILFCALFVSVSSLRTYEEGKPANLDCDCGWANPEEGTYPWLVAIHKKDTDKFLCTATILTEYHVLTAASSLKTEYPDMIVVCLGTKGNKCGSEGLRKEVAKVYVKSFFDKKTDFNNLALIRTEHAIGFNKYTGPVCFPKNDILNDKMVETELTFVGWREKSKPKTMDLIAKDQEYCRSLFPQIRQDMHICAVSDTEQNIRRDGAGSFVIMDSKTERYTLVGIVTRVISEIKTPPSPTLITNVTAFHEWVEKKVYWKRHAFLCGKK